MENLCECHAEIGSDFSILEHFKSEMEYLSTTLAKSQYHVRSNDHFRTSSGTRQLVTTI